jgi:hypothetical protein
MRRGDGSPVLNDDGSPAESHEVQLMVGVEGSFTPLTVVLSGRDLDASFVAPAAMTPVGFDCTVQAFPRKSGGAGYRVKGWRQIPADYAESLLQLADVRAGV